MVWGGVSPLTREGSGRGCAPSPENISIFEVKKASFGASWVLFLQLIIFRIEWKLA